AQKINFKKGEALNLAVMGAGLSQMGNYPKALNLILQSLKIFEQQNDKQNISLALWALMELYKDQKDYKKSTEYVLKALAMQEDEKDKVGIERASGFLADLYEKMNRLDSALYFANKSYEGATKQNMIGDVAMAQIYLGNIYSKMKKDSLAIKNYRLGVPILQYSGLYDPVCEATLFMAKAFEERGQKDSAYYYGYQSLDLAQSAGLPSRQLDAGIYLASLYERSKNTDSAFKYLRLSMALKDSLYNQEKLKTVQMMTFDETFRQQEILAKQKKDEENHIRNLQLLGIGVFIPLFFLIVLFLSRTKVSARVIEFLGILSLLLFFEFITDLIYPFIGNLTNENPIWEMAVLVVIAALLEPLNNKMEHWVKGHLVHKPDPVPVPVIAENISDQKNI
ncbi:MAG TPA: tetratricopeptide repeat protein, partial [Puia sp.]|nr:tetratricopeptide repeat protein [Puia sp.]